MQAVYRIASQCHRFIITHPYRVLPFQRRISTIQSASTTKAALTTSVRTEIKLREYQEECIQSVLSYLKKGHKRLGVSLATGSGKTVIFTHLIDRVPPPTEEAQQTLILVHRRELVEQAARQCSNAYPTKTIEVEMGNIHATGAADITIASVRSLLSGDRMLKYNPKRFKLVLVDEAHHIVASGYMEVLRYFGLMEPNEHSPALVGVSATFSRFDGLKLGVAIDHIVYHRDYVDMIGEKWLSNVIFTTVESKADISKVKRTLNGDFQTGDLSRAVNTSETNDITVRAWLARAQCRKSTIVFCVDLAHVSSLQATFLKHGIDARSITGDTPKQTRDTELDAFKNGEYRVLLNCGVFTEGTDIPNIDCVLLARPTKSRNLLVQMIGRGMRLYPGKDNCHVIDMVASLETGIVTVPSLFGLDPAEMIKEANVGELREVQHQNQVEAQRQQLKANVNRDVSLGENPVNRKITFTDYESVYDLIDDTSGERHIRAISQNAWVEVEHGRYILSMLDSEYLTLETVEGTADTTSNYIVRFTPRVPSGAAFQGEWRPFQRTREIAKARTFLDAVHAADTFASGHCVRQFMNKDQAWRKAPATSGQVAFLNKMRSIKNQLTADSITKGKAADMITKLKFGAKGRLDTIKKKKRNATRLDEKEAQVAELRRREKVQVGPLLD